MGGISQDRSGLWTDGPPTGNSTSALTSPVRQRDAGRLAIALGRGSGAAAGHLSHLTMPSPPTAPVALDKAYALALWLIAKTAAMPRAHRFTLGDRIYSQSLDLVTALTQASFSRDKSRALETAGDRVNSLRILLRLAKDIRLLSFDPYTYAAGLLDEIGRCGPN